MVKIKRLSRYLDNLFVIIANGPQIHRIKIELKLNKKVVVGREFHIERQLVQNLPNFNMSALHLKKIRVFFCNEDLLVLIFVIMIETKLGENSKIEIT